MIGDEDSEIIAEGQDGADGKSAFDIWLENGHSGNISDFLAWMKDTSSMIGPKYAANTSEAMMINNTPTLYYIPNGSTFDVYLADEQGVAAKSLATDVPGDITNYAGIYDVSADHNDTPYASLSAALAAIPTTAQKGGMTIKFILRSNTGTEQEPVYKDEYVQYILTRSTWSVVSTDWKRVNSVNSSEGEDGGDLDFADDEGNIALRISGGHMRTKYFDSQKALVAMGMSEFPDFDVAEDYDIGDVVRYDGLLYKFTSAHQSGEWDEADVESTTILEKARVELPISIVQSPYHDLVFQDDNGNTVLRVSGGHIRTQKFNSANINGGTTPTPAPTPTPSTSARKLGFKKVAHKGNVAGVAGLYNNTLGAFYNAAIQGFDMIELDVRRTSDNVYVIFHDATIYVKESDGVYVPTNSTDSNATPITIRESDYETLSSIVLSNESIYGVQRIPTLEQALHLCYHLGIGCQIDMKLGMDGAEDIVSIVRNCGMQGKVFYGLNGGTTAANINNILSLDGDARFFGDTGENSQFDPVTIAALSADIKKRCLIYVYASNLDNGKIASTRGAGIRLMLIDTTPSNIIDAMAYHPDYIQVTAGSLADIVSTIEDTYDTSLYEFNNNNNE